MTVVLDASMTIAWLFNSERAQASRAVLRQVVKEGALVPGLWRLEVANVLRNAVRRGRCRREYADRSLERLARLPIAPDAETESRAWGETRRLSMEHELTLYDACYLELAARAKLPLASCDDALLAAARRVGLKVLAA